MHSQCHGFESHQLHLILCPPPNSPPDHNLQIIKIKIVLHFQCHVQNGLLTVGIFFNKDSPGCFFLQFIMATYYMLQLSPSIITLKKITILLKKKTGQRNQNNLMCKKCISGNILNTFISVVVSPNIQSLCFYFP